MLLPSDSGRRMEVMNGSETQPSPSPPPPLQQQQHHPQQQHDQQQQQQQQPKQKQQHQPHQQKQKHHPHPQPQKHLLKKRLHRAPSPARPKDVRGWSLAGRSKGNSGSSGKDKSNASCQQALAQCRFARHLPGTVRGNGSSSNSSSGSHKAPGMASTSSASPAPGPGRAGKGKGKGMGGTSTGTSRCKKKPTRDARGRSHQGQLSPSPSASPSPCGSSSELSDCALSTGNSDSESGRGASESEPREGDRSWAAEDPVPEPTGSGSASASASASSAQSPASLLRVSVSTSLALSDLSEQLAGSIQEELLREMEEMRSENEYLKDEIEELRAEMLEMRDIYLEEDVYQLQELRQELDRANKTCRILQYRLRKTERRSLRVAQTGQVDGELIRSLEQDVKVSKDVSVRLHGELETIEKKRVRLEDENEDLRRRLIEVDVSKQVLQSEMDKLKESTLKKRSGRVSNKAEKKATLQEDSADLKCQLHFAKEEGAVMCKKLTRLVKENESMREDLAKYSSLYGDLDVGVSLGDIAESPHAREAEFKHHLRLVEEEANILSKRIVEMEVENRGLRAEMDEAKGGCEKEHCEQDVRPGVGEFGESVGELSRHLQFVEEEAELLRRSLVEMEEQNKHLMNELNGCKSQPCQGEAMAGRAGGGCCPAPLEASREELVVARHQLSELHGKVKKLEYENRVLVSHLQRYDLASEQCQKCSRDYDTEVSDSGEFSLLSEPARREVPIGGENDPRESQERMSGSGSSRVAEAEDEDDGDEGRGGARFLGAKDIQTLLGIKEQTGLVCGVIDLLIADTNSLSSGGEHCRPSDPVCQAAGDEGLQDGDGDLLGAVNSRLRDLKAELTSITEKISRLGEGLGEQGESLSPLPALTESASFLSTMTSISQDSPEDPGGKGFGNDFMPDFRDTGDWQHSASPTPEICIISADTDEGKEYTKEYRNFRHEESDSYASEVKELQLDLSEAKDTIRGLQEQLVQERELRSEEAERFCQKVSQIKEEHQKALVRRDFQLQSLNLQTRLEQKFWSQEKNLFVKEVDQFRQNLFLLYMKLKWFLKHWKYGEKIDSEGDDLLEVNSLKDLYLLIEEEELSPRQVDNKAVTAEDQPLKTFEEGLTIPVEKFCVPTSTRKQSSEYSGVVGDIKGILKELCRELTEERRRSKELQLQFANAKSAWEIEKAELKCRTAQLLDGRTGKLPSDKVPSDLKSALKREREEHQQLLAESYSAVMELTRQLQVSEKNWKQEKLELLDRFKAEQRLCEQRLKEMQNKINQTLHHSEDEKEASHNLEVKGTNLQRAKSVSSMSEFESLLDTSPYLPPPTMAVTNSLMDLEELNKKNRKRADSECVSSPYEKLESALTERSDFQTPVISSWDFTPAPNLADPHLGSKQIKRSYTAPDRTGIRIYYSPPVGRKTEGPSPQSDQGKIVVEPGFLFTMAKPKQPGVEPEIGRWLSNISQQRREAGAGDLAVSSPNAGFPPSLHDLQISGNMSDDMKEVANCVRKVIRSGSLERKVRDAASQTVGVVNVSTQTTRTSSVGLQTDSPRSLSSSLHRSWPSRGSLLMPTQSSRSKQLSSSLEKVPTKFERPCCSPKYGSPKLQRRSSSKMDHMRERSPWALAHRGQNESAWARSTTTRDSPVLSSINDGLSSLFNVVENPAGGSVDSIWKSSQHESRAKPDTSRYGIVQEFFRNVCGRSQSPTAGGGAERPSSKDPSPAEEGGKRQDSSPTPPTLTPPPPPQPPLPGHSQPENASRIASKRLLKQPCKEEQKSVPTPGPGQGSKDPDSPDVCATSSALEVGSPEVPPPFC
uniref:Microtubule crosslinking factor 2 n=1 Tax=Callorhinchus milii TaxID=7868 RepID=A0A4W3J9N9_CALMI